MTGRQTRTIGNTNIGNRTYKLDNDDRTPKTIYSTKRGNLDRKQVYTQPKTNQVSQQKAIVRYRKPTSYTTPNNRTAKTSRA